MYNTDLKYVAIPYRWGELDEQLVETPDYTAHITSFDLYHLNVICLCIKREPDLKNIPYLWIDAISVDQQKHRKKKEIILKMNQIYKNATYIVAVPDLHKRYLEKNTVYKEIVNLMVKYRNAIYNELFHDEHSPTNDIKCPTIANYAQQHVDNNDDWSNRAWVISEYFIAKEKYEKHKTPLKYMFTSLLWIGTPFFSYHFNNGDNDNKKNGSILHHEDAIDCKTFHQFVKSRFMQRSHLEMILNSNATRNED
ncbi:unnamed protein product [Cunninghamella blakesleeana]